MGARSTACLCPSDRINGPLAAFELSSFEHAFLVTPPFTKSRVVNCGRAATPGSPPMHLNKSLNLQWNIEFSRSVAERPASPGLRSPGFENPCVLCVAAAYCCGAVGPCPIAALLGRFLPRLGPLVHSSGPFFLRAAPRPSPMLLRSRNVLRHRDFPIDFPW